MSWLPSSGCRFARTKRRVTTLAMLVWRSSDTDPRALDETAESRRPEPVLSSDPVRFFSRLDRPASSDTLRLLARRMMVNMAWMTLLHAARHCDAKIDL